jgi:hypothetical protein
MRSVSDLIRDSKKQETSGVVVIGAFLLFVSAVLGMPLAMVWAANGVGF